MAHADPLGELFQGQPPVLTPLADEVACLLGMARHVHSVSGAADPRHVTICAFALDQIAHCVHIPCMTLQEWMDGEKLNDEELSLRIGRKISRAQIGRIRRGVSVPTRDNARLLEAVTKIPAAAFLLGDAARKAA